MSIPLLQRMVTGGVAFASACLAAVAIFFAPVIIYGDDKIMLLWGWVAPFASLLGALAVGKGVGMVLRRAMNTGEYGHPVDRRRFAIATATSLLLLAGCGYSMLTYGDQHLSWSEQVTLRDGSTLLVKRSVVGNSFGRPTARPEDWLPSSFSIDVSASEASALPVWHTALRPALLDRLSTSGNLVILAEPKDCREWDEVGRPNPPFLAYELSGKIWTLREIPQELLGRTANLLRTPRFTGEGPVMTAAQVMARNTTGLGVPGVVIQVASTYC